MEFFRREYCSGLPFPPSGDLPNPEIKPVSPALQVDSLPSEPSGKPKEVNNPRKLIKFCSELEKPSGTCPHHHKVVYS